MVRFLVLSALLLAVGGCVPRSGGGGGGGGGGDDDDDAGGGEDMRVTMVISNQTGYDWNGYGWRAAWSSKTRRSRAARCGVGTDLLRLSLPAFALLVPVVASAQGLQEEARRQLDLGWTDLEAGVAQRALSAAESALRLDPLLYDAMVLKGLAYEKLGEIAKARAILVTYLDFTEGLTQRPEAREALARLGDGSSAPVPALGTAAAEGAFTWDTVEEGDARGVSERLTTEFRGTGFEARYEIRNSKKSSEHQFHFPDLGWYFRVDQGGELKVRGKETIQERLDAETWLFGRRSGWNEVALRFDGTSVTAILNGSTRGPYAVGGEGDLAEGTEWRLSLDAGAEIRDLRVLPIGGSVAAPATSVATTGSDGALRFEPLSSRDAADVAAAHLGAQFGSSSWVLDYSFVPDRSSAVHAFVLPKLRFYVKIDEDLMIVKSKRKGFDVVKRELGNDWNDDSANRIQLELRGTRLAVTINGRPIGTYDVLADPPSGNTAWAIELARGRIEDLVVRPAGEATAPATGGDSSRTLKSGPPG